MTDRLEMLLAFISQPSATRAPVESPSTAPMRMTRPDALAEISYAANGDHRTEVLCALLRKRPEFVTESERSEIRKRLANNLILYALALRRPFAQERLAQTVHTIARACLVEHIEWEPCRTCNGKGRVSVLRDDGTGVVDEACPRCKAIGWVHWSDRKRARALGLSLSTAQNRWLELYDFGISQLHGWMAEGIAHMNSRRW